MVMKKNNLIISVTLTTVVATAITLVVLLNPPPSDTILSPYLHEPILTMEHDNLSQQVNPSVLFSNLTVTDAVTLPDNSVIQVGQALSDRNIYVPALLRTNLNDGAFWTTSFNPVDIDGVDYDSAGTSVNTIHQLIYVNPDLIYVIGTVRSKLVDIHGGQYPLRGFFSSSNLPIGNDLMVFIASFTQTFSNFTFHGFITPPDEAGEQATIVADATLLDSNTMVLVGVTNSQAGLFLDSVNKSPKDFVMSVDLGETITLNHLFTFDNSSYVQTNRIYALADGDLIVSGNFQEADGDFDDIPLNQSVETPAFMARIDGESFTLAWVTSNLMKNTINAAVTQYANVMELDDHHLVTVANVWEANETYDQHILITVLTDEGQIKTQKVLNLNDRDATVLRLYKATTGYWLAGSIKNGSDTNIMVVKLSASLNISLIHEIMGSGQEVWMVEPFILNQGEFALPIGTYSKDQDYVVLGGTENAYQKVLIRLT
jgi:hypothetical protein